MRKTCCYCRWLSDEETFSRALSVVQDATYKRPDGQPVVQTKRHAASMPRIETQKNSNRAEDHECSRDADDCWASILVEAGHLTRRQRWW
jgi:hypothetical protein